MTYLYIYPHPDDESFGPAVAIAKQRREGHEVFLLTLTKGGATRQRHRLGLTIEEMGEVRYEEMQSVARVLDLSGMRILDFPDSGLKETDPRDIERAVAGEIEDRKPHIVVTYPVHGISGFHDHLVSHAAVKRVYVEMMGRDRLRRLAFHTLSVEQAKAGEHFTLSGSTDEEIDCRLSVSPEDVAAANKALDCYETFQETIKRSGVRKQLGPEICFEIYQESFHPPLTDLGDSL